MINPQPINSTAQFAPLNSNVSLGRPSLPNAPVFMATSQVNPYQSNVNYNIPFVAAYPNQLQNIVTGGYPSYFAGQNIQSQAFKFGAYSPPATATFQGYNHLVGYKEPRQAQKRITYHPYTRTYIDYEERVILVPVQKVRTNYYEKIFETQFVPQAIQEIVYENVPVQKQLMKIQYIPVQQKIIHFPKDEKQVIRAQSGVRRVIIQNGPIPNNNTLIIGTQPSTQTQVISNNQQTQNVKFINTQNTYTVKQTNQQAPVHHHHRIFTENIVPNGNVVVNNTSTEEKKNVFGESQIKEVILTLVDSGTAQPKK